MTHYEPDSTKELPPNVDVLGVDGHGRTHFTTSAVGGVTVYVGAADGLDVFELSQTPVGGLEDWIDHVDEQRGWNRLNYTDNWVDHMTATISEALEA